MPQWVIAMVLVCISVFPAHAQMESTGGILKATLDGYIRPSYAELGRQTSRLKDAASRLCAEPGPDSLAAARAEFRSTVLAWSRIEWLRIGPVMAENRVERFLFYPDRKSTGLKQVQRALAAEKNAVLEAGKLAQMSVAMQGLGAFEYLVFGKDSQVLASVPQSFRCRYSQAVAMNLNAIAEDLSRGWEEGLAAANAFLQPGPDNPLFRADDEALNLIIGTMIHGLEAVRDVRIGYFLRKEGQPRPLAAVYRRSQMTMPSIAANLKGLEALFNRSGIEDALPKGFASLADQARFEFAQSIRTAESLNGDIEDLLLDETGRQSLEYLQLSIRYIIQRLNDEIASAAGLAAGFSFGDGD